MDVRTNGVASYKVNSYPNTELIKTIDIFKDKEELDFKEEDRGCKNGRYYWKC